LKKVLFINGSPEKKGNTASIAKALLKERDAKTLSLTDYRINVYGQTLPGDQFDEVLAMMKKADVLIIGSPTGITRGTERKTALVYLPGRFSGTVDDGGR